MISVIKPGFYSTIQDLGRIGYQKYGVPYSGVMDHYAAAMANIILGNNEHDAVMEITMTGPTLQFKSDTIICISGADMSPMLNNNKIDRNRMVPASLGDILSFGTLKSGFRCYLGVLGGFQTDMIMHSHSMYQGITKQFRMAKKDNLPILESLTTYRDKHASIKINESYFTSKDIGAFKGPEFELLSKSQQEELFTKAFTISNDYSRMAYQLKELLINDLKPIITSSVLPGTVQLTPSGKLIILMKDCQTTGGYPRVLQLKETAIDVLAQKYTGQSICFKYLKY